MEMNSGLSFKKDLRVLIIGGKRQSMAACLKNAVMLPTSVQDDSEGCCDGFGFCVSSGPLRSSHQNETLHGKGLFGEKPMKGKG